LSIIDAVKKQKIHLLSSDILLFEVHNILSKRKRGQGDAVDEISNYWRDLSIEDIHQKVLDWKETSTNHYGINNVSQNMRQLQDCL
jgi:hypothetical protein